MNSKSVIIVTVLALAGLAHSAVIESQEAANILQLTDLKTDYDVCGGLLSPAVQVKDQILYNPFKPVGPNQRCVWIVAVPDAWIYSVKLLYGGDDIYSTLNVAGVRDRILWLDEQGLSTEGTSVVGNHLVITFHTGSNGTSNGFALEYVGIGNNPKTKSFTFVDADTHFIKYAVGRGINDTDEEIATFVIPALNNVHVPGSRRQVIYNRDGLEAGCHDVVTHYEFNTETNRYTLRDSICNDIHTELITFDDVGLLIFRSISKRVGRPALNLAFANCGGN